MDDQVTLSATQALALEHIRMELATVGNDLAEQVVLDVESKLYEWMRQIGIEDGRIQGERR